MRKTLVSILLLLAAPACHRNAPAPAPAAAYDEGAEYDRLYAQCVAGCSEADRATPSPQDPEKTTCAFLCDYSATSEVELQSCRHRCDREHSAARSSPQHLQCLTACNPDHVEGDPTEAPQD